MFRGAFRRFGRAGARRCSTAAENVPHTGSQRGGSGGLFRKAAFTLAGASLAAGAYYGYQIATFTPEHESYGFGKVVELRDGRKISYCIYGPQDAPNTIFTFHGTGGSRLEIAGNNLDDEKLFKALGVKLVALDRPGYSVSTDLKDRTYLGYVNDVLQVADSLKIDKFSIVGVSGGGPYALACAYQMPKVAPGRLQSVGIVSSDGPWSAPDFSVPQSWNPVLAYPDLLLKPFFMTLRYIAFNCDWYGELLKSSMPKHTDDAKFIEKMNIPAGQLVLASKEGLLRGVEGVSRDLLLQKKLPWGFDLSDIKHDKMFLWHGEDDIIVPVGVARYAEMKIPQMRCQFEPNMGHLLVLPRFEDIVTTIVKSSQSSPAKSKK